MFTSDTKAELQSVIKDWGNTAFVPTMGALHDGHLSLIRLAKQKADKVIVSIFVNPTQFAPHEDFDSYPRDTEVDIAFLKAEGVDAVYLPSPDVIYPDGDFSNTIKTGEAAKGLETDFRPHFFDGVVNVVYRLFEHVKPNIAIFGQKDYQQLQVINDMVADYDLSYTVIGAPTARDEHGLALSSRNAYLSADELIAARQLNVILRESTQDEAVQRLLDAGFDKVDYVAHRWGRVLAAACIGKTRLIDNIDATS